MSSHPRRSRTSHFSPLLVDTQQQRCLPLSTAPLLTLYPAQYSGARAILYNPTAMLIPAVEPFHTSLQCLRLGPRYAYIDNSHPSSHLCGASGYVGFGDFGASLRRPPSSSSSFFLGGVRGERAFGCVRRTMVHGLIPVPVSLRPTIAVNSRPAVSQFKHFQRICTSESPNKISKHHDRHWIVILRGTRDCGFMTRLRG
jgi:hypothetical protein